MKKKNVGLYIFILVILLSCAITPKTTHVYDESIPLEQSALISAGNAGEIIGYNGVTVKWKNNSLAVPSMIQILAGDTLLEWNITSTDFNIRYEGKNILFRYNFQRKKQYLFLVNFEENVYGFRVYAYNFEEKIPSNIYNKEHFVGFVPFLNVANK